MTKFEAACQCSCEQWVDSFPTQPPKHKFSKKHKKNMRQLFAPQDSDKRIKFTSRTVKILILTAILLSLSMSAWAITRKGLPFDILNASGLYAYSVVADTKAENVQSLSVNYIPAGFERTDITESTMLYFYKYVHGGKEFSVAKNVIDASVYYDAAANENEIIEINGKRAVYYFSESYGGVIFNNGEYIFTITGNIGKEELIKIAQSVK